MNENRSILRIPIRKPSMHDDGHDHHRLLRAPNGSLTGADPLGSIIARARYLESVKYGPFAPAPWQLSEQGIEDRLRILRSQDQVLYPYQRAGVSYLNQSCRRLLFDDPGIGKTVQACAALPLAHTARVLIVCPKGVMETWETHVARWVPAYSFEAFQGRAAFRFPRAGEVVAATWRSLPDPQTLRLLYSPHGGPLLTIFDEAQWGKNPEADCTLSALHISAMSQGVWGLTGTPLYNHPPDLWHICNLVGYGSVLGRLDTFCRSFEHDAEGRAVGANERLQELLSVISLRREKRQVLDLPPTIYKVLPVEISDQAIHRLCDQVMRSFGGERGLIEALTRARLGANRARGDFARQLGELSRARAALSEAKFPFALARVADMERARLPFVVYSPFRACVDRLGVRPGWTTINGDLTPTERRNRRLAFQAGRLRGISISNASSEGVDLTRASHIMRIDQDWVVARNDQVIGRVERHGATAPIYCYDLVAQVPLDFALHDILTRKQGVLASAGLRS